MIFAARFLSWLFLPLNAPVIALAIVCFLPAYNVPVGEMAYIWEDWRYFWLIVFAFFSIVVPGITILFMRVTGAITTVMMNDRRERIIPALFVNLSAFALYYILTLKDPEAQFPSCIYALSIGSMLTVCICTIITRWWKISLHAAGMGILTGFLFAYYFGYMDYKAWILPASMAASGLVMSARMYLGAHNLAQCFAGFGLGFVCLATSVTVLFPH
jgi:hypothetical protein